MKIKQLLYFYRILNWKHKVSSIRPLGYAVFGYLMAGKFELLPLAANTLAVLGALFFWFSINDFSDLKSKDESFMGSLVKAGKITRQKALTFCLIPLVLTPLVIFTGSTTAIALFAIIFILNLLYSVGPLRLKSHKYLWTLEAILPAPLLFLECYTILGNIILPVIFMAIVVALFYFYTGILHILEDFQTGEKVQKIPRSLALKMLKAVPLASLIISLVFAAFYPFFLITTVASAIRLLSLKDFQLNQVTKTRRNLLSLRFSLYEFALYALFAISRSGFG